MGFLFLLYSPFWEWPIEDRFCQQSDLYLAREALPWDMFSHLSMLIHSFMRISLFASLLPLFLLCISLGCSSPPTYASTESVSGEAMAVREVASEAEMAETTAAPIEEEGAEADSPQSPYPDLRPSVQAMIESVYALQEKGELLELRTEYAGHESGSGEQFWFDSRLQIVLFEESWGAESLSGATTCVWEDGQVWAIEDQQYEEGGTEDFTFYHQTFAPHCGEVWIAPAYEEEPVFTKALACSDFEEISKQINSNWAELQAEIRDSLATRSDTALGEEIVIKKEQIFDYGGYQATSTTTYRFPAALRAVFE